jgi:3-deoxy-manno-octulosonate cytidylyltransferase (CMP-KDO synthetase)
MTGCLRHFALDRSNDSYRSILAAILPLLLPKSSRGLPANQQSDSLAPAKGWPSGDYLNFSIPFPVLPRGKMIECSRASEKSAMPDAASDSVLAIIPARYDSSRFPGKPLASIAGRPMIQHVVERVRQASRVSRVLVATDDERIRAAVSAFGGEVAMTRRDHRSGTERIAEVAARVSAEIYVNVQGDEPLISPHVIDVAVAEIQSDPEIPVATLCVPIEKPAEIMDPNVVKVVMDFDGNALYFSRAPIPWVRDAAEPVAARHFKHIGIYVFRRHALLEFATLPPGELEHLEQLEQLRWLENGYRIRVAECEYSGIAVDVPADVPRVEQILRGHP